MKNIFLLLLAAMSIFTQVITLKPTKGEGGTGGSILYWLGLPNPEREHQINLYRAWMIRQGLTPADVKVDSQNQGLSKLMIQSVSGIAGDLPEFYSGNLPFLAEMGILEPLEPLLAKISVATPKMYDVLSNDFYYKGRLYALPCNVSIQMLVVNGDFFRELGMDAIPALWDFDLFEKMGRDFNRRKAEKWGKNALRYFTETIPFPQLRLNSGISLFNETLTGVGLDQARYHEILKRYRRWVYEDHFIPTSADRSSYSADAGAFAGASFQLFAKGYYGMIFTGRHVVVELRKIGFRGKLDAVSSPHQGYQAYRLSSRMTGVYAGSRHKEDAVRFLSFFGSRDLNEDLVSSGDALPPTVGYAGSDSFLRPEGRENEWPLHRGFSRALGETLSGSEITPFLPKSTVYGGVENKRTEAFMSGVLSAEQTATEIRQTIDGEIERYVKTRPELQGPYHSARERQSKIDTLKAQGKKIPLAWVENDYLREYYRKSGQGE